MGGRVGHKVTAEAGEHDGVNEEVGADDGGGGSDDGRGAAVAVVARWRVQMWEG